MVRNWRRGIVDSKRANMKVGGDDWDILTCTAVKKKKNHW
jgi:hypothetical protein